MYGQTGFGGGVESLDSSLFRFCPPIILWVCSFFFNQFKNLFAFLLDLICATIQRYFFFGEASERASFLRFSFIFAFTCYSLLLLLLLFFDLDLFLLLSFFLGCHLSVCHDHYCTGALPSRGKEEGDVILTSAGMYPGWRGGV
jgi:hypothetical protein